MLATARDPEQAAARNPEIARLGGEWARLDVDARDAQQVAEKLIEKYEKIDVLVNCAGCSLLGAFEDMK